ncbi:hypothetical protein M3Y97_00255600 [Aphelenchoides bicaudatus]|nr:hypothetical protein M3Y97_00255600 [Aphelenchoides bicaudatus]
MHRKYLSRRIGLFLLLRFLVVYGADDTQRKCRSNVCFNGGTCVVEDRGSNEAPVFECLCTPDFGGTLCEEAISCSLKCQNEGKCQLKDGKPSCECKHGFGGELCQDKVSCQQTGCPKGEIHKQITKQLSVKNLLTKSVQKDLDQTTSLAKHRHL